jgi:hypothetical protein
VTSISRTLPPSVDTPAAASPGEGATTPRSWRIAFPPQQELLNANQRLHWAKKNAITQQLRSDAFNLAKHHKVPRLERARIDGIYEPPDRRKRDAGNYYPTYKAAIDGLVDAGVLPDDDSEHCKGPFMDIGERHPGGRIVLIITELPEETSHA